MQDICTCSLSIRSREADCVQLRCRIAKKLAFDRLKSVPCVVNEKHWHGRRDKSFCDDCDAAVSNCLIYAIMTVIIAAHYRDEQRVVK